MFMHPETKKKNYYRMNPDHMPYRFLLKYHYYFHEYHGKYKQSWLENIKKKTVFFLFLLTCCVFSCNF